MKQVFKIIIIDFITYFDGYYPVCFLVLTTDERKKTSILLTNTGFEL